MAGDWIKVEIATPDKPEVAMLANLLGINRRTCMGMLLDFWVWWDRNAGDDLVVRMLSGKRPANVQPMTAKSLDDIMKCDGFSAAMVAVGWVEIDEDFGTVSLPNCGEHNGKTAKNRALDNKRKAESRSGKEPDKSRTRLDKSREEQNKSNAMSSSAETTPQNLDVVSLPKNNDNRERRDSAREILGFLNAKTGRNYRMTDPNIAPIMARMKEGATVRELRAVIARKCREWSADEKMSHYLRPATLFNATKFAQYVGEVPPESEVSDG